MDEKHKLADEAPQEPKQGSGSILAAARKLQKRSVEEIADELNLSVTQIRTIELDQSEGLPEPTYVRGYIRSYARLLGLNADEVLAHYLNPNWQKGTRLDDMPRGIGSANEADGSSFFTPAKVVTILCLLSLAVFLWLSGQLDSLLGSESQITVSPVEQTANQTEYTQVPPASEVLSVGANQADSATADDTANSGAPALIIENQLVLTFTDTSWIDIRDSEGERLAYKSYAEGEDLAVTSASPMSVFIGNAKAVSATFNGEPYDISQYREGVFARFTVGEELSTTESAQ